MRRVLRWTGFGLVGLVGVACVAYALVAWRAQRLLDERHATPPIALVVPDDAASIAEGRRQALLHGCVDGCHGRDLRGDTLIDEPMLGRIVAPNLTAAAHRYAPSELALVLRHGMRPDGRGLLIMPSQTYAAMDDADLGRLIAYLKSVPMADGPGPSVALGPVGRLGLAIGEFKLSTRRIAETVPLPAAADPRARQGRYLAASICSECHGTALTGERTPAFASPSLEVVAAYGPDAFTRLLRTGVAPGGREVGVMSVSARNHLSYLTDDEIAALYAYLHAFRPARTTSVATLDPEADSVRQARR